MSNLQDYIDKALSEVKYDAMKDEPETFDYNINGEIADLIISLRNEMNITQEQLAEKSGVSQANISKIENGKYMPSIKVIKRIADALGKRIVIDLIDREEE